MKADCVGGLMETAMENIREMVEVNTIIGDAVETPNGTVIIPVSRMCCGFASGGTHVAWKQGSEESNGSQPPFGGGAGAGVSVQPVGFLVVTDESVRLLPAQNKTALERAVGCAPQLMEDIKNILATQKENREQKGLL